MLRDKVFDELEFFADVFRSVRLGFLLLFALRDRGDDFRCKTVDFFSLKRYKVTKLEPDFSYLIPLKLRYPPQHCVTLINPFQLFFELLINFLQFLAPRDQLSDNSLEIRKDLIKILIIMIEVLHICVIILQKHLRKNVESIQKCIFRGLRGRGTFEHLSK